MIVTKGIELRLYPNKGQATMFNKNIGAAIVAYNACIKTKEELYRNYGITFNPRWQYLKDFFPWMSECDSRAILMASRNAETAYKNWFRNLKKGIKKGHPNFKKRGKKGSYTTCANMPTEKIDKVFREGGIFISKVGVVKFRSHQDLSDIKKIRHLTIKRSSSGKYYCSICCDVEVSELQHTGACVGVDLGLKDIIVTSDGQKIKNNHFAKKAQSRIRMLQKQLSRRKKGSKNREKTRVKLAIAYEKLGNSRKDFIHKLTTNLVRDNDIICIEDLNVKGMLKNHKLAGAMFANSIQKYTFPMTCATLPPPYRVFLMFFVIPQVRRGYPSPRRLRFFTVHFHLLPYLVAAKTANLLTKCTISRVFACTLTRNV